MIIQEGDRWIVQPADVPVDAITEATADSLGLTLADGLGLRLVGGWKLVHGPNRNPANQPLSWEMAGVITGRTQKSLVLFDSGSVRAVFSGGYFIYGSYRVLEYARCWRRGDFCWEFDGGEVVRKLLG